MRSSSENRMEGCACDSALKPYILGAERPASLTSFFMAAGLVEVNNIEHRFLALEMMDGVRYPLHFSIASHFEYW